MRLAAAAAFLMLLIATPLAAAKVERARFVDAAGNPLAVATWDDDKAMGVGGERSFLVLVEGLNRTRNLTVAFEVARFNESALAVLSPSLLSPLGKGPVELAFRLRANASAPPGREQIALAIAVVDLNATSEETSVTRREITMNVTLTRIPTPLGETPATLSDGERTALLGAVTTVALVAAVTVRIRHGRGP